MRYCKVIFERYKDKVKLWLTFNEINAATMVLGALVETSTIRGFEGPISELPDNKQERYQALHHQFVASAMAVKYAHLISSDQSSLDFSSDVIPTSDDIRVCF